MRNKTCGYTVQCITQWSLMPLKKKSRRGANLSTLMAPQVVMATTCGVISDDKNIYRYRWIYTDTDNVGILTQWPFYPTWYLPVPSELNECMRNGYWDTKQNKAKHFPSYIYLEIENDYYPIFYRWFSFQLITGEKSPHPRSNKCGVPNVVRSDISAPLLDEDWSVLQ